MKSIVKSPVFFKLFHPLQRRHLLNKLKTVANELGSFQSITLEYIFSHAELYRKMMTIDASNKKQVREFFGRVARIMNTVIDTNTGEERFIKYHIRNNIYFVFGCEENRIFENFENGVITIYANCDENPDERLQKALEEIERRGIEQKGRAK